MDYTKAFSLDLNAEGEVHVIAKQGDSSTRILTITMLKDGVPYVVPTTYTAQYREHKPDGHAIINTATINSDGTITVTLTSQCLAVAGQCQCDVAIVDGTDVLSTVTFYLDVIAAPDVADTATSSNEFATLIEAIARADGALWYVGTAVTGTGTGISAHVEGSKKGSMYLNSSTYNVYCATATDTWNYSCNIKGTQGDQGVSISSITKTSTSGLVDTYTITYSDSTTTTFNVTNGAKGDQGDKGDTGDDGVSPSVTIGTISGGHSVTITDKDHPSGQTFNVIDGTSMQFLVVQTLPSTGVANAIYFVPSSSTASQNLYDEYIWVNSAWEKIGSASIDLSAYRTSAAQDIIDATKITNPSTKSDGQALIYNATSQAWEAGDVSTKAEVDVADNSTESLPTPSSGETHEDLPSIFVREETDSTTWYTKAETDTLLAGKVNTSAIGNVATLSYTVVSTF